ncbi:Hsp20/alpha crystallin family protein [Symbiobacterium terraclitae]|uniref:Hsp20/alpha crystallin family protein n=1 Tax=Symbiobacterium terraclitae TaxID=557451 RepID=UPI0035B54D83
MTDPVEAAQRIAEQLEALGDAFGEEFWREVSRAGTRKKGPPRGRGDGPRAAPVAGPPLDIYVTPHEVVVEAVLPGLTDPHQVTVGLAGPTEMLMEAYLPDRLPDGLYIQRERFAGYCARLVTLPVSVRPAAAVRYEDGILELRFPRLSPGTGSEGVAVLHVPPHGG